ncbi:MAG TPA: AraC family transcriptional regulator ligand-binding domain-containing protein [Kofleriaceae bacterium]|jgi:AraC-like DNA-binding protein|nr:AraC family transcriptional regulator ligand-binding domain-containing protein [Kofleriaceae bacterium]
MPASTDSGLASAYVLALVDVVARWQVSEEELLSPFSLSRADLLRPRARVEARTFHEIARRAEQLTGEPGLPLFLGLRMRVAMHGYVGFAAMSAATMRESMQLIERFSRILVPASWRLEEHGDEASMTLTVHPAVAALHEFITVSTFVGITRMASELAARPLAGRAELSFPEVSYYQRLRPLLGEARVVQFGCPRDRIVFPSAVLDQPIVASDPIAVQLVIAQCERELQVLGKRDGWVLRVLESMRTRDGQFRQLRGVAKALGVSARSLKRHLADAGTTFSKLVDETKRERATDLLFAGTKIESIAAELGYADTASFLRAFRRWSGMTPGEYRKRFAT